jgi:hypothetical protein
MSDIARQYPSASAPGLYSGSAASNAAGAGLVAQAGKELATSANSDKVHDYRDDRTR